MNLSEDVVSHGGMPRDTEQENPDHGKYSGRLRILEIKFWQSVL